MSKTSRSVGLLEISLAILFIAMGLAGITHYNSAGAEFIRGFNRAFGGANSVVPIVMSIIELVAGVFILLNLLRLVPDRISGLAMLIVLVYWAIRILMNYVFEGFAQPDFLVWLGNISPQLVILAAVWTVYQGRMS